MSDADIIDGTVEEIHDVVAVDATPSATLTLRAPSHSPLVPIDPDQAVASMKAYQQLIPRLLEPSDFESAGFDKKTGKDRKFVKRSGWRKIARAFNLSVVIVERRIERDADGSPIRAEVVARAIAPNDVCHDADGYCSVDEDRFQEAKGRKKLENDLRTTATTRAKSRAISDLIGMGDISAEGLSASAQPQPEASAELQQKAKNAIGFLLEGDVKATTHTLNTLSKHFDGRLPASALQAVCLVAAIVKDIREGVAIAREEAQA